MPIASKGPSEAGQGLQAHAQKLLCTRRGTAQEEEQSKETPGPAECKEARSTKGPLSERGGAGLPTVFLRVLLWHSLTFRTTSVVRKQRMLKTVSTPSRRKERLQRTRAELCWEEPSKRPC